MRCKTAGSLDEVHVRHTRFCHCCQNAGMTNARLQVAVMGAGAVGCYFGGMLARGGHDVTLIARPQHVEAINRDGLHMETKNFDEHVRLMASSDPAAVKGAQLVLFCVKSGDTETRGRADQAVCWQGNGGAVPAEWLRQ